jgi:hypothetical protein
MPTQAQIERAAGITLAPATYVNTRPGDPDAKALDPSQNASPRGRSGRHGPPESGCRHPRPTPGSESTRAPAMLSDAQITANYAAFRRAWEARKALLAHTIACALAAGDTVRESLGSHATDWTLSCAQVGIIPGVSLPWMVKHLVARHLGFGTHLEFPAF